MDKKRDRFVIVRGGGDLATGTIYRLYRAGFKVLILETAAPTAIRREAAFCEAVRLGSMTVEGVTARRVNLDLGRDGCSRIEKCWDVGEIPLIIDEEAAAVKMLQPLILVDAIMAKRNVGTNQGMASFVVALGPGFTAGRRDDPEADVDVVIETMRGHDLGRLIYEGSAAPNTGVPGLIGGEGLRRVVHAPSAGIIQNLSAIGDIVEEGQAIARILPEDMANPRILDKDAAGTILAEEADIASTGEAGRASVGGADIASTGEAGITSAGGAGVTSTGETGITSAGGAAIMSADEAAKTSNDVVVMTLSDMASCGVLVRASLSGVLRGIIQDGFRVWEGMKIADIDPRREQQKNCRTISDKARALGGSVLEAIDHYLYVTRAR